MLLTLGGARSAGLVVNTVVVHRPDDEAIRALALEYRAYPVATRPSASVLSDSLRAGIEVIRGRAPRNDRCAVLICLGDQPRLRLDVIKALVEGWRRSRTAWRPAYRDSPGEPGHPLLIDRSLWGLADELRGDGGFASVLARHAVMVNTIPVGGTNPDVDTVDDLSKLNLTNTLGAT